MLERGWLSSNNILVVDSKGATLIDSGYVSHATQTEALVRHALQGRRLTRLINTHLHSDHCGGNATLQRAFGCQLWIPPGQWEAVKRWDIGALSYAPTGQQCDYFVPDRALEPGSSIEIGGRPWSILGAPGHDPHSVVLFDSRDGVLVSADALWENGFGIVFPELEGHSAFGDVAAAFDLIEALQARVAIPGHGRPFTDIGAALGRARRRLDAFVADPVRHARHAGKVLIKFRLLERQRETEQSLLAWASGVWYLRTIHERYFYSQPAQAWYIELMDDLCRVGALRRVGQEIVNT